MLIRKIGGIRGATGDGVDPFASDVGLFLAWNGSAAADIGPNALTVTNTGTLTGVDLTAINGLIDYDDLEYSAVTYNDVLSTNNDFTAEFVINMDSIGAGRDYIMAMQDSTPNGFNIQIYAGTLQVYAYGVGGTTTLTGPTITANTTYFGMFTHVSATGAIELILNGNSVDTGARVIGNWNGVGSVSQFGGLTLVGTEFNGQMRARFTKGVIRTNPFQFLQSSLLA